MLKHETINLEPLISDRSAICYLNTESGNIHLSILTDEKKILTAEIIPENYPQAHVFVTENLDAYKKTLLNISDWIQREYVVRWDEDLLGPPVDYNPEF